MGATAIGAVASLAGVLVVVLADALGAELETTDVSGLDFAVSPHAASTAHAMTPSTITPCEAREGDGG